jgi:hypothetical protein
VRTPIRAALLHEPGKLLELAEVLLDEPAAHEVVVRTERVGLCHSDLHYLNGALSISTPAVLGHEVAGVVQTVGLLTSQGRPGGGHDHALVRPVPGLPARAPHPVRASGADPSQGAAEAAHQPGR